MSNFVKVSDKVALFYRLLAISSSDEKIGAEELLIYMKCLVYLDTKKTISIFNIGKDKDFSIEKLITNKETVLLEIDSIIEEFLPAEYRAGLKEKIVT